jgi:hypothetical protein
MRSHSYEARDSERRLLRHTPRYRQLLCIRCAHTLDGLYYDSDPVATGLHADKRSFGYINDRARQYLWKRCTVLANIGRRDGTGSLDRIVTTTARIV